jgi:hypothetical protein
MRLFINEVHVHAYVQKWNEKPPSCGLDVLASGIRINTADDYVSLPDGVGSELPVARKGFNPHFWVNSEHHATGNINFLSAFFDIVERCSNESIQVREFGSVTVVEMYVEETDVSELLSDVGTTSAQPDDGYNAIGKSICSVRAEE